MTLKIKEHTCQTCNGTGFPVVAQPIRPDHKIYPVNARTAWQGKDYGRQLRRPIFAYLSNIDQGIAQAVHAQGHGPRSANADY